MAMRRIVAASSFRRLPIDAAFAQGAKVEMQRAKCRTCAIRDRALCRVLPPDALAELNRIVQRRRVPAGQQLLDQDRQPHLVANIVSGVARLSRSLPDGRTQIVGLQFSPEFLGRHFAIDGSVVIESATDMELCYFPRGHFEILIKRHQRLAELLLEHMARTLEQAREWMLLLGRKTAEERVASLVLHCAERMCGATCLGDGSVDGACIEMPLSRTEIADCLGLTLETVGRSMKRLAQAGAIEVKPRRGIQIIDSGRLRRLSGDSDP
jgi:CRP/FNR family transcriptional regulator